MIHFAQKPGLFAYWVRYSDYTKLAGQIVRENKDVTGYGRFQAADLSQLWDLPGLKVFKDGDHLCALVGGDLQEGTAEFAPLADGKELFDQITDLALAFKRAHPEIGAPGCDYWEPHEIEYMAEQSRQRAPQTTPPALGDKSRDALLQSNRGEA